MFGLVKLALHSDTQQYDAKLEGMRKQIRKSSSGDLLQAPAYPHTGPQLFERLRTALTDALGFQPSFERLARILGERTNVTHY
jgi:hypothetical protein